VLRLEMLGGPWVLLGALRACNGRPRPLPWPGRKSVASMSICAATRAMLRMGWTYDMYESAHFVKDDFWCVVQVVVAGFG